MYEIIKNVIEKQDFDLRDILYKIAKMYIEGYITEEEKEELEEMARNNAKSENSYAPLQEQIDDLYSKYEELYKLIKADEPENPVEEEYPEYKQPTGAHDAYNTGAKITFKGERWEALQDGLVWSPEEYPQGWKLINTEETENTEETIEDEEESV